MKKKSIYQKYCENSGSWQPLSPLKISKRRLKKRKRKQLSKLKQTNLRPILYFKSISTIRWTKLLYARYIESKWWAAKRLQKLRSEQFTCEKCGGQASEVHHKHYDSLGREKNKDLVSICRQCHQKEHDLDLTI